tara:strand:+ start:1073 stop:1288 length:216 start_codon:yes stop_codon:yes gene_type:complete
VFCCCIVVVVCLGQILNLNTFFPLSDSALLSLPFGGAVLESMDVAKEEVVALMEEKRKGILIKENSEVSFE